MKSERRKTLIKYVLPTVLSSVSFFLFTIIDGIFIGRRVGDDALGAVNILFPFIMVVNAFNMLITTGGVTVAAIRFGRGDDEGARNIFMHAVSFLAVVSVVFCLIGTCLTRPIGLLLGANDTYIDYVVEYLLWYSVFIVPAAFSSLFQGFVRNDGSPVLVMAAVITGSALNIFLDWLFVFPLNMKLMGAAVATGISQTVTLIIMLFHFITKRGKLKFCRFKPSGKLYGKIIKRGFPETVAQFASPVSILCTNYVLLSRVGDVAENAFSVLGYVAPFAIAIFFGVAQGTQPLFGQCYGDKNEADMKYYFRAGLIINVVGSVIVYVALLFVGGPICALFQTTKETLDYVVRVMPQYAWGFIMMSANTIISAYLYSTKRTTYSVIINVLRSFVFTTAVTLAFPAIFGAGVIWYCFGIYETLSLVVAAILLWQSERKGIVYK